MYYKCGVPIVAYTPCGVYPAAVHMVVCTYSTQTNQYIMAEATMPNGESMLQKIIGTEIQWKPGKDVTVKARDCV